MGERVIANRFEDGFRGKDLVRRRRAEGSLDYLYSENLDLIEEGIRSTSKGIDTANLAIAVAIAKIDREALYRQAGYRSNIDYFRHAEERLDMPKQTISDYRLIGDAYLRYRRELEAAGFEEAGNLHKLRYLDAALKRSDPATVFERITRDSFRKFREFVRGGEDPVLPQAEEAPGPEVLLEGDRLTVGGKPVIRFEGEVDTEEAQRLCGYLKEILRIRAAGNEPAILEVYDEAETRQLRRQLARLRAAK